MVDATIARGEWRRYWLLPIVAALGTASSVVPFYSLGPFMAPVAEAFGWSRAQVSSGLLVSSGTAAILSLLVGIAIDRIGPRPVGLIGVALICTAFALLGLLSGTKLDWYLHWLLIGFGSLTVQTTVWASAVSSRFVAARGLAIAVTMCGSGVAAAVMPVVASLMIARLGWQSGFVGVGLFWAVLLLPPLWLFFRGAQDGGRAAMADADAGAASQTLDGLSVRDGFRAPAFYKLALSGAVYAAVLIGTIVHFVPILEGHGRDAITAALIASLVGIASIAGRLSTGLMLDRFRGDRVAAAAFVLPIVGLLLLALGGPNVVAEAAAAMVLGFSLGAELDVVAYLATRYLGLRHYGTLFGAIVTALGAGTAFGPIAAGATFDRWHSYAPFLLAGAPAMALCAAILWTLGPYPAFAAAAD